MKELDFGWESSAYARAKALKVQMRPESSGGLMGSLPKPRYGGCKPNVRPELCATAPTNMRAAFSLSEGPKVQNG